MQYGDKTTFVQSLKIQGRVINALLMREIITRYGRQNIGFLWLFVEPLLLTLIITLMWGVVRASRVSDLNIIAFTITGYPLAMMWRNTSNRAIGAIASNVTLLYHRNVRVLDTIMTRMFLEIIGASVAQVSIMAVLIALDIIPIPADIFYMLVAWLMMGLFAIGLGLIICSIAQYIEPFGKIWGTLAFVMLPLSGAFFFVDSLPQNIQVYASYVPMISGTEMFRKGYFGDSVTTHEDILYLFTCNLTLIFFGLLMVRNFSKGIEPR